MAVFACAKPTSPSDSSPGAQLTSKLRETMVSKATTKRAFLTSVYKTLVSEKRAVRLKDC